MPPQSKKYEFTTLISENQLCQSWQASDLLSGEVRYVKTPNPNGSLDTPTANQILVDSFVHQRLVKTPKILTATARHNEDDLVFIEYPFLDRRAWSSLTPEVLSKAPTQILLQIGLIVDYLHLLGLVHGDLKLANFLLDASAKDLSIILIDLDFLSEAHQHPRGKVFGTPGYIPPEVDANQIIVPQSDNYSLGVSLKHALDQWPIPTEATGEKDCAMADKLGRLIARLNAAEWSERPRYLTGALLEEKIIDGPTYEASQKTLLGMKLLGDFRLSPRRSVGKQHLARNLLSARNRVMGLSDELLLDMTKAFEADRLPAFRLSRRLLDEARTERFGDYWHITPNDQQLRNAFQSFQHIHDGSPVESTDDTAGERRDPGVMIEDAVALKNAGCLQKSLFALEDGLALLDGESAPPDDQRRVQVLQELVEVSSGLNRLNDASKYCDLLLEGLPADSSEYLSWLYESTLLSGSTGDTAKMKAQIEAGGELATSLDNREQQLKFSRLTAWQLSLEGKHDDADAMLKPLCETALQEGWFGQAVLIQYTRGVLEWRRGDYIRSEQRLLDALKVAKSKGVSAEQNPVHVMLTQLYFDLAEYDKSVKYGKRAVRRASNPKDLARLPAVFPQLMSGCVRLGEYKKAEYWLHRYLNLEFGFDNTNRLVLYHLCHGFLKSNMGDLAGAQESWRQAAAISSPGVSRKTLGKVHQNLAEVALFQGDVTRCDHHAKLAVAEFDAGGDKAAQAEVQLIRKLCQTYYDADGCAAALVSCLRSLIDNNCRFYAAICLFHLLTDQDSPTVEEAGAIARPVISQFEKSKSPLLNAAASLVRFAEQKIDDRIERLRALKDVYRVVDKSGQRFLSLIVCQRLAHLYEEGSNHKLAQKFYANSLKIARALDNSVIGDKIEEHLKTLTVDEGDRDRLINSIHGISETISSFDDYDESLLRMVRFAVEQTGAERGALLLKRGDKSELQVVSYLHCDDDSLADIQVISSKIPRDALAKSQPIIIENALTDKRTKEYQSIIYHNILSVACLPIVRDGSQVGALYLDHHTIPALFDKADVVYMNAIANFLSVLLAVAQRQRASRSIQDQLLSDLNRLGVEHSFVTNDPSMRELLSHLTEIARSNSPVLITGESGTGKEILAQLIHSLSLRADHPFIKMNCSAIAKDLIESELFGVAKNIATGVDQREGKFSAADSGTLLLDEIGDMALSVQAKLLRVLEYQQFEKVGSNRTISVDVRFLYSTNKDLRKAVKEGGFREDLYFRFNTFTIEIPPLRDRPGDISLLTEYFISVFAKGKTPPSLSSEIYECLNAYHWPGNVRELRNLIERLCILHPGRRIEKSMLPEDVVSGRSTAPTAKDLAETREKTEMIEALLKTNWNQTTAAMKTRMSLTTFRRKMKKFGIKKP